MVVALSGDKNSDKDISFMAYLQVLHLMNKMDLPAPFGPVTAQPPMVES